MKKIFLLLTIILTLLSLNSIVAFAESNSDVPQEVLAVAKEGAEIVKSKMSSNPQRWGFESTDDINSLTLGEGFHVNYIDVNKLSKSSDKNLIRSVDYNIIDTWEFTLDSNGVSKTFLTVAFEDDAYRMVNFGGNAGSFGLAKNNFRQLISEKDADVKPTLMKFRNLYYFVTEITNEEFALPVDNNNIKLSNKLNPTSEVIKNILDMQESSVDGERGSGFISQTTDENKTNVQNVYIIFLSIAIAISIVLLAHKYIYTKKL